MVIPRLPHLLLILATATTSFANPSRSHLITRESMHERNYDPFIVCEGTGPTHAEGLPEAYDEEDYTMNLHLCSAAHGIPHHNVGCFCSRSQGNVHCDQNMADQNLWNAMYQPEDEELLEDALARGFQDGRMPFWELCWINCLCVDAEEAGGIVETGNMTSALSVLRFHAQELIRLGREGTATTAAGAVPSSAGGGTSAPAQESFQQGSWQRLPQPPAIKSQCGTKCTTDRDCKVSSDNATAGAEEVEGQDGSSCTCRTQSSQYLPGNGGVAFVAACLIDMAKGGKRDEEWPCPCNSTYVSHGCCAVEDGLVWEAKDLRLGGLLT